MVWRSLQFILGAALAGGGGYLAWLQRDAAGSVLPPGPSGLPLLFIAGVIGVTSGIVFLVSAVHPRPNQRRARAAAAARDEAALQEADRYYSERARATDRDWRASDITPPAASQSAVAQPVAAPPPPKPLAAAPQPVAAPAPPKPAPVAAPQPAAPAPQLAPQTQPAPPPKPVAPVAPPPPQAQTVQAPPANPFPASVTLAPLPRTEGPAAPASDLSLAPIRTAISQGRLPEAERMLHAARETAAGLDLAKLTALAGDHAAALGQPKHARWLWRLAMKRFGEHDALGLPEARAVMESLSK